MTETAQADSKFFLSAAEMFDMTGLRRARRQVEWVRRHYPGCPAHVNAANEAVVIRSHLDRATTSAPLDKKAIRQVRQVRTPAQQSRDGKTA